MKPGVPRQWARWRDGLRDRRMANVVYRAVVAVIGLAVLTVGVVTIPYPGPGWAVVFAGLGILATEFAWARRLLRWARRRYDLVMAWFWRQGRWVQVLGAAFTVAVVLATMWVLGVLAWAVSLFGIEWRWVRSPLGLGS